jgi:hypothetical protein
MLTANSTCHPEQVQPTAQISAVPIPHDCPKFVMTLVATCVALLVLVLARNN